MSEKFNDCPHCQGRTWVCERHPDQPFEHTLEDGSMCGGAGCPCPTCGEGITFADGIKVKKNEAGQYDYSPIPL